MAESRRAAELAALRQRLALIERGGRPEAPVLPFGVAALDAALPGGGLACAALHEVCGLGPAEEEAAEPAAFLAGILARLTPARPVLWCLAGADLYAPGLALCGLAPERLVLARARDERDLLWAMEEGLKCRALAAVVGEVAALPDQAGRRLQLAAETGGIAAFVLRRRRHVGAAEATEPSAAVTRWRVSSSPSRPEGPGIGRPLWRVELLRCRGGAAGEWLMEACDATGHVHLADALADRPAPLRARAG